MLLNILGGIDNISRDPNLVIETVGGFDKNMKIKKCNVVIGGKMTTFVKNVNTEWETFKDVYYKNDKLKPKYYDKLIDVMNNIFPLPVSSESDKEIIYMIDRIYNSSNKQIYTGIENYLHILSPIKDTIRFSFMAWKQLFEKLIENFVILRELYISKNDLQQKNEENNFNELIDRWVLIDAENMTNTSSPILFFNFPPKDIELEDSVPKIIWHIKGGSAKITNAINAFLKKVKSNKFIYKGYCGNDIINRYKLLLLFPYDEILQILYLLNPKYNYTNINKQFGIILKEITKIQSQFVQIKTYKPISIKKKQTPAPQTFPKSPIDKIKFYETYISIYLDLYNQLLPDFNKKEKLICEFSVGINVLSNDIYKLIELFDECVKTIEK